MTNLTTRIQAQIAKDRALLAAGTQGKWEADLLGNWVMAKEGQMCVCDMRAWSSVQRRSDADSTIVRGHNATLIGTAVNSFSVHLDAIEGLLVLYARDRCMLTYPARQEIEAILTRWVEAREVADGEA